jgi:hypothetical protein
MKPQDLLQPDSLPEDLRWLAAEFKLSPKDPVFLLIAWHWHRVQQAEDTLARLNLEFQTAVDSRLKAIAATSETLIALEPLLGRVQEAIVRQPASLQTQVETELKAPIEKLRAALESLHRQIEAANRPIRRREVLAVLSTGAAIGALGALILFCR